MSNRPNYRHRKPDRHRAALADAEAKAPVVVFGSGQGNGELSMPIKVGDVLYVVPMPPAGASEELLMAYSSRATATVTGRCPECGARRHTGRKRHVTDLEFRHENACSASDERIREALAAEGFSL